MVSGRRSPRLQVQFSTTSRKHSAKLRAPRRIPHARCQMAKKGRSSVVRLMSQAGTGYFYTIRRAIKANMEKLQLIKFDPRVNARVLFKEEKIKK